MFVECMPCTCISITFEPTCAHYLVLVAVACAFGTVSHVRDGKAYVERVWRSERGFEHLIEGENMVVSQDGHVFLCFASCCSSLLYIDLTADFTGEVGEWLHFGCLSLFLFLHQSSSSFVFALITIFCHFDIATMRPSATTALKMINLCKCTQLFVNMTFNCIPKQNGCLRTSHTLHS